mmetsp:Transcript_9027/g.17242  ORF Transcript_9027/g.17242 Transcript_9027/m.17242 type:complete len:285 (+) Transcript_9027:200-1054(+)|eukprot:scaffold2962_cov169-Amphora_coffeaeformis.AAC.5
MPDSEDESSSSSSSSSSGDSSIDKKKKTKSSSTNKKKSKKKNDKKEKKKGDDTKKKDKKDKDMTKSKSFKKSKSFNNDSDLEDGPTDPKPKNPDGSLWKNPLKFWTNKPKQLNEIGAKCIMKPTKGTDVFCRTKDSLMDNANFYWHKYDGDFNVLVKIKGNLNGPYDKAGIMLRQDERNWCLSGLEYFGGRLCLSTCITRGVTDWSLSPLPDEAVARERGVWIAMKRQEGRIACFYSVDLNDWIQTRMGPFEVEDTLKVGLACTCPTGDPYKVVFERYSIQAME